MCIPGVSDPLVYSLEVESAGAGLRGRKRPVCVFFYLLISLLHSTISWLLISPCRFVLSK